ncbi:MAG TPA: formate/nitrite transporter family protein [Lachnospiraceae bacterium]|nr:formate/nitrite transporter family protein [Lachnospiraceae bacterium]
MYQDDYSAVIQAAKTKINFLKGNPIGYFLASVLAGMFVGFGILLIFSVGGLLSGQPYAKVAMGLSFGIALSLVIMAGSELFTGNNFVMTAGVLGKSVTWKDTIYLWVVCFIGNWVGAILLAFIFFKAGFATGATGELIANVAATKMNLPFEQLLLRGILCNILVCLAVWCGYRCKSESGKLIMIFWCLFAFITSGFEHSIANMTLLTISLFAPLQADISMVGYLYNILSVTLGNMVGGILFLAIPYFLIARKKEV